MPYTKEQLEEWIKGFSVSDDKKQALLSVLADPDLLQAVGNDVMRQSDYSRKMDELRDQRRDMEAKQAAILARETELEQWYDTNSPKYDQAVADLERTKQELQRMTADYIAKGHSLAELGQPPNGNGGTPPKAEEPKFDDSKYVKVDDLKNTLPAMLSWTPQLLAIQQEHFKLTGEYPDGEKILAEVMKGKNVRQAWEETHGIAALRQQKAEADVQARIDAAVKDAETRVRTELAVDPSARRDTATKGFAEGIAAALAPDDAARAAADAASRSRAAAALEGFDPRT